MSECSFGSRATRVRVDASGDVVMTPVDQTQQSEDFNLHKIVAQLHVNLGHPSNDALVTAIRLSGGSDESIHAALKVRCAVCERLTEPSPVPAASLRRWSEFGQCVALDLFMFADITGRIVWTCRNLVDTHRAQRISQFAGETSMVAAPITP